MRIKGRFFCMALELKYGTKSYFKQVSEKILDHKMKEKVK